MYIYIYICVCVCVCVKLYLTHVCEKNNNSYANQKVMYIVYLSRFINKSSLRMFSDVGAKVDCIIDTDRFDGL